MGWLIFFVIAMVMLAIWSGVAKGEAINKAKAAYDLSLGHLADDPTNPLARKSALDAGRAYSNLTRDKKGVTVFDEVALMNDINAACGGAAPANPKSIQNEPGPDLATRLSQLQNLKDQALITEAEYLKKREQLLSEI